MPKKFDKSFKINAVNLVKRQGLSVAQVSHDLGIGLSTLERWIRELKVEGVENAFPGSGHLKLQDEQVRRLERENEVLRRERDILKNPLKIDLSLCDRNSLYLYYTGCLSKRATERLLVVYPVKKHGPGRRANSAVAAQQ